MVRSWCVAPALLAVVLIGRSLVSCGDEHTTDAAPGDASDVSPAGEGGDADGAAPDADPSEDASAADAALEENPVVIENGRQGTKDWMLESPATEHEIEGYASATSVAAGETLELYVNTTSARYTLAIYRLGWYGGKGGRLVGPPVERDGHPQIVPTPDPDGLIECDWTDPYAFTVPSTWISGAYVAKLTAKDGGKQSYIPFVVRDDVRSATYLFQSSVTTYQAYNFWGGRSLYDFNSEGEVRASRVSFRRPYTLGLNPQAAAGVGAGELFTNLQGSAQTGPTAWEYPMVRFLEREGYDVSYVTNLDVHRDATLVARHRVFLSVGHDEYWSSRMRDHVERARDHDATSLAFFSGNVSYWQVRFGPSKKGAPDATMTCFKDAASDPVFATSDVHQTTVRFATPPLGRSEEGLAGVAFQDFGMNADLVVTEPSSWVFAGTGLAAGSHLPGLLGYEVDGASEPPLPGVRRVMRSPWMTPQPSSGVSDVTVRALPSGAETFAAGSIQFAWGVDDLRLPGVTQPAVASAAAQQVVRNVLDRFAGPRPAPERSPILLTEPFSGPIDAERWSMRTINEGYGAFDPAVGVTTSGGRLVITPRAGVAGLRHGGVVSARTYALTCASARVELVQAASALSAADTTFALAADPAHHYRFTVESGTLVLGQSSGGAPSNTTLAYDPAAHRHLRLRHDCVSDRMLFETSADGLAWTPRRDVPRTVDLRATYVELEAGTYQEESAPGQAIFDDLRVELTGVREDFARQRDPEVFTPDAVHEGGYDPEMEVFVSGGRLHLRPRAAVTGKRHMGLTTTRAFDWRGGVARVAVVQAPDASSEASAALAVLAGPGGWARTAISAGSVFFQLANGGTITTEKVAYDPAAHAVLRIRHDAPADEIVWETSPDGAAWTERRRASRPFALDAARAEIEAGTYRAEASPGEVLVDDFVFAR